MTACTSARQLWVGEPRALAGLGLLTLRAAEEEMAAQLPLQTGKEKLRKKQKSPVHACFSSSNPADRHWGVTEVSGNWEQEVRPRSEKSSSACALVCLHRREPAGTPALRPAPGVQDRGRAGHSD